jgi:lipoprotein-releasing system permease protein
LHVSRMNAEKYIADRISGKRDKDNISTPIVKIGIAGISLGIAVMIISVSIVLGFKSEITSRVTGLTAHITIGGIGTRSGNDPKPIRIGDDTLLRLRSVKGVELVQPVAFKHGILRTKTENEGMLFKGIPAGYDFNFLKGHITKGRLPVYPADHASKEILISEKIATRLNLDVNSKMVVYFIATYEVYDSISDDRITKSEVRSRDFHVCGIFKTSFADFDDRLSLIDLRQIRKLNQWADGYCGTYEVRISNFDELERVAEEVGDIAGFTYSINTVRDLYYNIFVWLDKLDINGIIIIVLMLVVATVNMITALLILILERAAMIGMLKALGMPDVSVRKIFMRISMRLTAKGLLWGNLAGIGLCLIQYYFHPATLNSETYYVDHVAIELNWPLVLALNAGTVLVCTLMLVLPTFIITALTPVRTLKFE